MTEAARARGGIALVAVLAILASANSCQVSSANARQFPDSYGVDAAMRRLAPVIDRVPKGSTLAYFSDLPLSETAGTTAFLAAQFALSPSLLIPGSPDSAAEWAVGNFARPADFAALGAASGYSLVEDFGSGVILYRRSKP